MGFIIVDQTNVEQEHICCAISDKKGETCVSSKKKWMQERFEDGLVFLKLDQRGKVFIEYLPAEKAWCPIDAEGYFFINCFWVSGQFKGQGYADQLLDLCIKDVKEKGANGLVVLSSTKKMPFLSDPKYLKYKGFQVADQAEPYFELLYLNFDKNNSRKPAFKPCVKKGEIEQKGLVLYYSNQCPHTDKYAPIIQALAKEKGKDLKLIKLNSTEDAQNAPTPFTTYSLFYDGKFVTNEIL
ncbi:MAG: GNAT family N-acetyltransferase, partial [Bacillota bacterium]